MHACDAGMYSITGMYSMPVTCIFISKGNNTAQTVTAVTLLEHAKKIMLGA